MKSAAKMFYGLTAFFVFITVAYIYLTINLSDTGNVRALEWAGGTALVMATLMTLMLAGYLHITERSADIAPADWEEAEVSDAAGTLGFFSPNSIWPFWMTVAILFMGFAIAFWQLWLLVLAAVGLIFATVMLSMQYYWGPEKH
ncbi:cytochrome c oxidase subunit 4 [Corynebacterium ulceribovis]|uniref:aa3-type cytochrome oxidase subunit IV n=1 Tax=Corynebacterium ulceribovis TaxID=487732 RepID=UPI00037F3767|nr:cytochrome c oxidase subunit 4 [Corynebacterium ulceribovis]